MAGMLDTSRFQQPFEHVARRYDPAFGADADVELHDGVSQRDN